MKMCSPEPLRGRTCCPAVKGAMGRVPPAACSFGVCFSCVEPDALLTAMLFPGKPTFGEWARRAFKDPDLSTHSGMTLMGNVYSTTSCQVGHIFFGSASQCDFFLCSILLPPLPLIPYIHLELKFYLSVCTWRIQPVTWHHLVIKVLNIFLP